MNVSRRGFVQWTAVTGAALVLGISRDDRVSSFAPGVEPAAPFERNKWLRIDADGGVTIVAHRSEMGQGVRTSLPMIVAEELGADWSRVRVEHARPGAAFPSGDPVGCGRHRHEQLGRHARSRCRGDRAHPKRWCHR